MNDIVGASAAWAIAAKPRFPESKKWDRWRAVLVTQDAQKANDLAVRLAKEWGDWIILMILLHPIHGAYPILRKGLGRPDADFARSVDHWRVPTLFTRELEAGYFHCIQMRKLAWGPLSTNRDSSKFGSPEEVFHE